MDLKTIQPSIDELDAEIARLTAARDTLQALTGKPTGPTAAQRKMWAEAKRKSRERKAAAKPVKQGKVTK